MAKIVTIKDVARTAGVSSMTVSRVLNDHLYVSPKTRKRIQGVIDELGYVPSEVARNLSHGHSNTIGVVRSCLGFSGPSCTLVGIEKHFPRSDSFTILWRTAAYRTPEFYEEGREYLRQLSG